jgi:hypothetical protein
MTPNFIEILEFTIWRGELDGLGMVYGDKLLFSGQGNITSAPMRFEPMGDRMGNLLANLFATNANLLL